MLPLLKFIYKDSRHVEERRKMVHFVTGKMMQERRANPEGDLRKLPPAFWSEVERDYIASLDLEPTPESTNIPPGDDLVSDEDAVAVIKAAIDMLKAERVARSTAPNEPPLNKPKQIIPAEAANAPVAGAHGRTSSGRRESWRGNVPAIGDTKRKKTLRRVYKDCYRESASRGKLATPSFEDCLARPDEACHPSLGPKGES